MAIFTSKQLLEKHGVSADQVKTVTSSPQQSSQPLANKVTNALGLGNATQTFGKLANQLGYGVPEVVTPENVPKPTGTELVGAGLQTAGLVGGIAVTGGSSLAGQMAAGAGAGYLYDVGSKLQDKSKTLGEVVTPGANTAIGAIAPAAISGAIKGTGVAVKGLKSLTGKTVSSISTPVVDTIESFGKRITSPSVSDATRVSLNPKEALKGTGQDLQVSVGGKLKKLSELTPSENTKMQFSTEKSINKFTKEAELFKNNRLPKNDPTEIVGNRVDAALNFADKKRQAVGKKMGEIELKYADESLPIGEKTLNHFAETLKSIDNPKFGVDSMDAPIVKKLVQDFDNLEASGATIADRMDFVRSWDKYLNDSKDAFGNFKENATVNARIQGAVKTLKDETVNAISSKDKVYKGLRGQYSVFKKLDENGNRLLGRYGDMGDRVKGGATVKRALKSNSDAGSRQFLTQLKELTGYDAIKDGDLALTAMENVGDFHGLSLLEVLKQGKTGMIGKGAEFAQNKLVGSEAKRVSNFVKKGVVKKASSKVLTAEEKALLKQIEVRQGVSSSNSISDLLKGNKQAGFIATKKTAYPRRKSVEKEIVKLETQLKKFENNGMSTTNKSYKDVMDARYKLYVILGKL
jgi:hypothetical protein